MSVVARPAATPAPAPVPLRPVPLIARLRWSWRLIRRSTAVMWLAVAVYLTVEVLVFRNAYPDAASRQRLLSLSTSTAVRMMQGIPGAVDTGGGFAVWDGGWMILVIVACWALLAATRLTRGEEDSGRADLVLCRPVTAREALLATLGAMGVAAAGMGVAAAAPFVLLGEPVAGALLWGAGLAAFAAVAAALGAVAAQVAEPRRRAISLGLGLVAATFLVRAVANSADSRAWLLGATPFGWVDRMQAFGANRWWWLLPPAALALALTGVALAACARRDVGDALLRSRSTHRSSFRLLGGASGFGWRIASGALLAWTVTFVVLAFVFGLMTGAVVDFLRTDQTYRKMLEAMGMDMSVPATGYLSYIAIFLALPFAAFTGWRLGTTRQEEAEGRLDNLLVRGVVRRRWLAVTAAQALMAAAILLLATTVSLWAGAVISGAPVSARQVLEPMAGTAPVVALFVGIAVLVFGVAPRLTVAAPVSLAVACYLLDTLGAAVKWPGAVLALSPFHHLARLPGQPMTVTSAAVITGIGLLAAAIGIAAFARRDVRPA